MNDESSCFTNGITGTVTLRLVWPERPVTANWAQRAHRSQKIRAITEFREAFRRMAVDCPPMLNAVVTVEHETATRRKVDVVACAPAVKAAIDGVVLAGVLPDDGPDYVTEVRFLVPMFTGRDALVLTLEGDAA